MVCARSTIGLEIVLDALVPLGDEAEVDARFRPFGDKANHDAREVHGLCRTYHGAGNHFGRT